MKKVRITVMRKACYKDLMAKYENPLEHACDMEVGQAHGIVEGHEAVTHREVLGVGQQAQYAQGNHFSVQAWDSWTPRRGVWASTSSLLENTASGSLDRASPMTTAVVP